MAESEVMQEIPETDDSEDDFPVNTKSTQTCLESRTVSTYTDARFVKSQKRSRTIGMTVNGATLKWDLFLVNLVSILVGSQYFSQCFPPFCYFNTISYEINFCLALHFNFLTISYSNEIDMTLYQC